ncbi:hypothetical protein ACEWY4_018469 [Coilia grayii]|uniref:Spindle and centriole-associated protein 1 n=1 Tax=Coilia grayii TaxID=363190 RepID=A0ABD1JEH7_9TELE
MSYARGNRLQYGSSLQGKRPARPKKTAAPKKEWVSTVNDLTVHKATPEELSRRHEMHKSQNRVVAQWELREKALRRRRRKDQPPTPPGLDKYRLNLIREVFSDQCTLQDVLARSDRAMAVVKDLFGDAPHRQAGIPRVTVAPGAGSDPELPVLQRPDPPTQLSILSQSMVDPQALNDLEEEYSDGDHDSSILSPSDSQRCGGPSQKTKNDPQRPEQLDHQSPPQTPCNPQAPQGQTALNATVAVERVRSRQAQEEPRPSSATALVTQVLNPASTPPRSAKKNRAWRSHKERSAASGLDGSSSLSSLSGNQSSLELLQSMLGQVESELDSLGPLEPTADPEPHRPSQGLTGFSVALVSTIGRLTRHLRRREEDVQKEAQERRRLEEVVMEQRVLIDALSAETLSLRDESAALQAGLQQRMMELEQRVDTVVLALGDLGPLQAEGHLGPPEAERRLGPPEAERRLGPLEAEGEPETQDTPVPDPQRPVRLSAKPQSICPAVLLSPPRQRDSHTPTSRGAARAIALQYHTSSVAGPAQAMAPQYHTSSVAGPAQAMAPQYHTSSVAGPAQAIAPQYHTSSTAGPAQAIAPQYHTSSTAGPAQAIAPQYHTSSAAGTAQAMAPQYEFSSVAGTARAREPQYEASSLAGTAQGIVPQYHTSSVAGTAQAMVPQYEFSSVAGPAQAMAPQYEPSSATGSDGGFREELDRSSPCSFASLPRPPVLLDPSLGLPPHLQEALRAQIAELARQSAQALVQMEQRQVSPGGSHTPREQTSGRSSPASLAGQRTAPPSGHQPQAQQAAHCGQAAYPTTTNMEERLLELSRQSAAARSKLLELIDQQRQNSSMQVSPCVSPIAFRSDAESPTTAISRRTPEAAMSVPERDSSFQSSGGSIRSAGIPSQNLNGADNRRPRPQVERRRGDGWFALSNHVQ